MCFLKVLQRRSFQSVLIILLVILGVIETRGPAWAINPVLIYIETQKQGVNDVDGLSTAQGIIVSPDGKHVYAVGYGVYGVTSSSVAVFSRNPGTGGLTFVEALKDGMDSVDGLDGAYGLAISQDGKHVYVAAYHDDAVAIFQRNQIYGTLTFTQVLKDSDVGVDGLNGAHNLVVSPDGAHIYITGKEEDALAVFSRDSNNGQLIFVEVVRDSDAGVDGLKGAYDLTISPDGKNLYATGYLDNAVTVFNRDNGTGKLTFVHVLKDTDEGVDGLSVALGIAISPNGRHVYATGYLDDAIASFSRNSTTGVLTFIGAVKDTDPAIDGLSGARDVIVSSDGARVYVVGTLDNSISVFDRDEYTGALTYRDIQKDGMNNLSGLKRPYAAAITPDGSHLYITSSVDETIGVFRIGAGQSNAASICTTKVTTPETGVVAINPLGGVVDVVQPNTDLVLSAGNGLGLRVRNPSWHSTYQIRFRLWDDPPHSDASRILRAAKIEAFDTVGEHLTTLPLCNAIQMRVSLTDQEKRMLGGYSRLFKGVQTGTIQLVTPDDSGGGRDWIPVLTRFNLDDGTIFTEITVIPVALALRVIGPSEY